MYQPQHLPCFKFFFSILCTNPNTYLASNFFSVFYVPTVPHPLLTSIPTRPARIRTTSQTRHTNPHTHHHTPANTFPRSHAPLSLAVFPTVPPYHCTVPPYHRTTAPYPQPHHCIIPPDTRSPYHTAAPFRHPQAVPTQYRRSTDAAPDATGARRRRKPPVDVDATFCTPDAGTPLIVPACWQAP